MTRTDQVQDTLIWRFDFLQTMVTYPTLATELMLSTGGVWKFQRTTTL
jgi:hypothetical protein